MPCFGFGFTAFNIVLTSIVTMINYENVPSCVGLRDWTFYEEIKLKFTQGQPIWMEVLSHFVAIRKKTFVPLQLKLKHLEKHLSEW